MVTMEKQSAIMLIGMTGLISMRMILSIFTGALSYLTGIKTASMYSLPFDCTIPYPKKKCNGFARKKKDG